MDRTRAVVVVGGGLAGDTPPRLPFGRTERLHTAMPLAWVGGFLDAYTFVGYNGIFANTQTGNIVLLGVYAQAGHWREALLRIPPIVAFVFGVALAQMLAQPAIRKVVRRPTRWVLIAEIAVLAAVGATPGWIPSGVVTGAIAFVSAAQMAGSGEGRWWCLVLVRGRAAVCVPGRCGRLAAGVRDERVSRRVGPA